MIPTLLLVLAPLQLAPSGRPVEAAATDVPTLILERDDTRIDRSVRVVIPEGLVVEDADGDGVLHVVADDVEVTFAFGSVLRGAPAERPQDQLAGVGVRIAGHSNVRLRGLVAEGFKVGVWASDAQGLEVTDARLERGFAQRLGSTLGAEDGADWLWPHENDQGQWAANYGAAVRVTDSEGVRLEGVTVRSSQNGLMLERVERSSVVECDASFLSGWGLALWRSSDNLVAGNAFDYCIRGYSHGVYNRGQDSAGILAFEQCSRNRFLGNSVTHGGDGFFGFSGREALGETALVGTDGEPLPDAWYRRRGNNANVFEGNDFSYAAAHGLELTFGFGNVIRRNVFRGNAICGVWGGYSQDTVIEDNLFAANGDAGYGLERGGVNIDHAKDTLVRRNRFGDNACGVHLWKLDGGYLDGPWGRANLVDVGVGAGNRLEDNTFVGEALAVHLRGDMSLVARGNRYLDVAEVARVEGGARLDRGEREGDDGVRRDLATPPGELALPDVFADRASIVMTEWGPWDGTAPLVRRTALPPVSRAVLTLPALLELEGDATEDREGAARVDARLRAGQAFELLGFTGMPRLAARPAPELLLFLERDGRTWWPLAPGPDAPGLPHSTAHGEAWSPRVPPGWQPDREELVALVFPSEDAGEGLIPYAFEVVDGPSGRRFAVHGVLDSTRWRRAHFPSPCDPREDPAAWEAAARAALAATTGETFEVHGALDLPFGMSGPLDTRGGGLEVERSRLTDHFGTLATASVTLPAGRWRVRVLSDDGVRLTATPAGGPAETWVDDWTWHAPREATRDLVVEETTTWDLELLHFELDGYAVLKVAFEHLGA